MEHEEARALIDKMYGEEFDAATGKDIYDVMQHRIDCQACEVYYQEKLELEEGQLDIGNEFAKRRRHEYNKKLMEYLHDKGVSESSAGRR